MWTLLSLWVALAAPPAEPRLVTLGVGVTETVFALGLGDAVVGVDTSSLVPAEATKRPKVGYVRAASAEGILALKPTLVLADDALGPPPLKGQLEAVGVKVVVLPKAETVEDAAARVRAVGEAVGRKAAADELAVAIMTAAAEVRPKKPAARALFVFVHGGATLQVAGKGTGAHAMLTAAGAENAVQGYAGYRPLTAEAVVLARPTVVVTTTRALAAAGGEEALWRSPGLAATPAGQARRLVVLDDALLLAFGPRTGLAVAALAEALGQP
ncbi:MAG: ABC transporter substrate-binding protein [Myxococcales bacterium]|nr:ABC transporter substrate-binding protein [Myxococcales bacterium]